jgi:hypothetical protein
MRQINNAKKFFIKCKKWWNEGKNHNDSAKIIKAWYTETGAVLQLKPTSIAGIAAFRINHASGCSLLLTLHDLAILQGEVLGYFEGSLIAIPAIQNSLDDKLTHRLEIFQYQGNVDIIIRAWDINLHTEDSRIPQKFIRKIALYLLYKGKYKDSRWQQEIEQLDWIFLFTACARRELKNPHHDLRASLVAWKEIL